MERQSWKAGLKGRNTAEIDRMFASRIASVDLTKGDVETFRAVRAVAEDFQGLRDVSTLAARATELGRDARVRAALQSERDEDRREENMLREIASMAARLTSADRPAALNQLRQQWRDLSGQAKNPADSTQRRLARRVLSALSADGTNDADYAKIIAEYRLTRSPG